MEFLNWMQCALGHCIFFDVHHSQGSIAESNCRCGWHHAQTLNNWCQVSRKSLWACCNQNTMQLLSHSNSRRCGSFTCQGSSAQLAENLSNCLFLHLSMSSLHHDMIVRCWALLYHHLCAGCVVLFSWSLIWCCLGCRLLQDWPVMLVHVIHQQQVSISFFSGVFRHCHTPVCLKATCAVLIASQIWLGLSNVWCWFDLPLADFWRSDWLLFLLVSVGSLSG